MRIQQMQDKDEEIKRQHDWEIDAQASKFAGFDSVSYDGESGDLPSLALQVQAQDRCAEARKERCTLS